MRRSIRFVLAAAVVAVAVSLFAVPPVASAQGESPEPTSAALIPDTAFAACLERAAKTSELTAQVLAGLTTVSCWSAADASISDLTGVDLLTEVRTLRLASSQLTEIGLLGGLPDLRELQLNVPAQVNLAPLADLPALSALSLTTTPDHDLRFLDGMELDWIDVSATGPRAFAAAGIPVLRGSFTIGGKELETLSGVEGWSAQAAHVWGSKVTDLSPLEGSRIDWLLIHPGEVRDLEPLARIEGLTRLWLMGQPASDLHAVGSLKELEVLDVSGSAVSDLSPLAGMPALKSLSVRNTPVVDVSVAATLPSLASLDVSSTEVTDLGEPGSLSHLRVLTGYHSALQSLEAVRGATGLESVNLNRAQIRDLSPLSDLPDGATVLLDDNQIHDFSPLAGWTGTLSAIGQKVTLPDVVAETSYPIALLDEHGELLDFGGGYRDFDGVLHYTSPAAMSFQLRNSTVPATITIDLRQNVLPGKAFTRTRRPTITGGHNPRVGRRLTVSTPAWTPAVGWYTYQWFRNGTVIEGATGSSYTPTSADYDTTLRVAVTGHREGYGAAIANSAFTDYVAKGWFASTPAPRITGTRAVGKTLTATLAWSPKPSTTTYQWYRDGRRITKATKSTYKLVASDRGKRITVKVTGKKRGYYTHSRTSAKTSAIAKGTMTASAATITGTPAVGRTLTAIHGAWTPTGVRYSYQWYRDTTPIRGATAKTRRISRSDVGHTIAVRITGRRTGYTTTTRLSPSVTVT